VAYSARGTVGYQPLTLSVVPFQGRAPDPPPPPPRQRTTLLADQSAWPRCRALFARFRMASRGIESRCLQSPRSTSTTGISRAPFGSFEVALESRVPGGLSLARRLFRGLASRASLIRGPRRLSPPRARPGAIAHTEVGYPDPGDPDTFCRRRVARKAGAANLAGGLRLLLRAHRASSLTRNPPPGASLSQDLPAGPLPVSPREGSHVPRSPRCLPSRAALLRGW